MLLVGKNALIVVVSILINEDVFESSYDLKLTVRNRNYFSYQLKSLSILIIQVCNDQIIQCVS